MAVASFTPNEAWLFAEHARRALVADIDGKRGLSDARSASLGRRARGPALIVAVEATNDDVALSISFRGTRARLSLGAEPVLGSPWRAGWVLELTRATGGQAVELAPGLPPVELERADVPVTGRLRRRRLATVRGDVEVPLFDAAFHRHTTQSTAVARPGLLGFAPRTSVERGPWWEVDLGEALFVRRVTLGLEPLPPGARVLVLAFATRMPDGRPALGCFEHEVDADDTPRRLDVGLIARWVRVEVVGDTPCALGVSSAEILAAEPHGPTLRETMRRALALHHDRVLFEDVGGRAEHSLTYGEVAARVARLAKALARRLEGDGRPRPTVLTALHAGPAFVTTDLAAVERGYVLVPVAPGEPDDRLVSIVARTRPRAIVCEPQDEERFGRLGAAYGLALLIVAGARPEGSDASVARIAFDALLHEDVAMDAPEARPPGEDALHSLLFTSGSTGTPKGAMRTYAAFHAMLRSYGLAQAPRHLSFQPVSHLSERMALSILIVCGATIGFSEGGHHLLAELRRFEPTAIGTVPRLFEALFDRARRRADELTVVAPERPRSEHEATALAEARAAFGPRVLAVSVGSAPVGPEVLAFLRRCFAGLWVTEGYGITETGTIARDGVVEPTVEARIAPLVDGPPTNDVVTRGELLVRTPHLVRTYLGDDGDELDALDAEGWFHTGDLVERRGDGRLHVVGRMGNTVKLANGEFVSAEHIETRIAMTPDVERVFVEARPGARAVAAILFTTASLTDAVLAARVRDVGRGGGLAPHEVPQQIIVARMAPSLENGLLTPSGKLARAAIAARFAAELAAGHPRVVHADPAHGDELLQRVVAASARALGKPLSPSTRLDDAGIDSLATAEVLSAIGSALGRDVPLSAWFAASTLSDLAVRLAGAPDSASDLPALALEDRALSIPTTTGDAHRRPTRAGERSTRRRVLLTGATGLLGAHLLEALLTQTSYDVTCLVRADGDSVARARLAQRLRAHRVPVDVGSARVEVLRGDVASPTFGLAPERYDALRDATDAVVHAAAEVSWLSPYVAMRDSNVLGTLHVLAFAEDRPAHLVSTVSTAPVGGDEATFLSFELARRSGPYALTKWVAEEHARRRAASGAPTAVYRPGMITGHATRGGGNPDDFVHRLLAGCVALGAYIDDDEARLDMTPADFVADALVALFASTPGGAGRTHTLTRCADAPSFAEVGRALARAGHAVRPTSYEGFRAALVAQAPARLAPLTSFFAAEGMALGMGPWPCAATDARLSDLGIRPPAIDDAVIARAAETALRWRPGDGP